MEKNVIIEAKDLVKTYGEGETITYALNHVSINVYEHEFLVIVGGSGSGKSTFLNMLGGIDNVDSGEIFVNGEDIVKYNDKELTLYRRDRHGNAIVYFGVKDNGEIVGVKVGNKTMKDISQAVSERIKPLLAPRITEELYGEKVVIKLEVSGTNTPYSSDGNYFIRSGNENRKIDPDTMRQLIFRNSNDNIVEIESFNQDLTFTQLWQLYVLRDFTLSKDTFIKNTGLITRNNKYNLLGYLLADNNDVSIKVIRFKGLDKTEIISRN